MKVMVRLLGDLRRYLPPGSGFSRCELELAAPATLADVLARVAIPAGQLYKVSMQDEFVPETDYANTTVQAGQEIALFPPIKGG